MSDKGVVEDTLETTSAHLEGNNGFASNISNLTKKYRELSDSEKQEIHKMVKEKIIGKLKETMQSKQAYADLGKTVLLVLCIISMLVILVFFGYKLYKSLKEKERKKDEKKKLKQQKKKK